MAKKTLITVPTFIPASTPLGNKAVGDIVKLNVGGVAVEFLVVHQGNPDATLYDASCDGTWLLMKDIYEEHEWSDSTSHIYSDSTIHAYLNSDFISLFDSNMQSVIKQVKIPYRTSNSTSDESVASGAEGLPAKAFLLCSKETGSTVPSDPVDGACLSYFNVENFAQIRIAYMNNNAVAWMLRTHRTSSATNAVQITDSGSTSTFTKTISKGVRPALILPSNLGVNDDGTVLSTPAEDEGETVNLYYKAKKGFITVDSVYRKIKKGFITVGGIFKQIFGGGKLSYYGTATALSYVRHWHTATSVGNYALFIGGSTNSTTAVIAPVDAYDPSLVRSSAPNLQSGRSYLNSTTVGNYAVVGPGYNSSGRYNTHVDAYDTSLVRSTLTNMSTACIYYGAASNDNYAIFVGGKEGSTTPNVYDKNLTKYTSTVERIGYSVIEPLSTRIGEYALFGGGYLEDDDYTESRYEVYAYNNSLTMSIASPLPVYSVCSQATFVDGHAIFPGNDVNSTAYNKSLTQTLIDGCRKVKYRGATSLGGYAIFAGAGAMSGSKKYGYVDIYDSSLTHTIGTDIVAARERKGATVGDFALFGGGYGKRLASDDDSTSRLDTVYAYRLVY